MPRRRKSGLQLGPIVGLAGGIAFLLLIGAVVVSLFLASPQPRDGTTVRRTRASATDLSVREYLDNANAMRGNSYRVSGTVEEQLRWSPSRGRLVSVVLSGEGDSSPVPVVVPPQFSHLNLEKGARFTFVVEVGTNGVLVVTGAKPG